MPYKDKRKRLEYGREWYKRPGSESYRKRNREGAIRRLRELKDMARKYKEENPCRICGESREPCLQFHHPEGTKGEHTVSQMTRRGVSKKRLTEEMNKCVVLCANCHFVLHAENR